MRELKDYFCTETQTQELIKLGLSEKHGISAEQYETAEFGYSGFLRSQALDFFRDLGYEFNTYQSRNQFYVKQGFNYIAETTMNRYQSEIIFTKEHEAERALISKLIELEKEARNGN